MTLGSTGIYPFANKLSVGIAVAAQQVYMLAVPSGTLQSRQFHW
jgi:hypothetical protein